MGNITVNVVNAFIDSGRGGNPAGVVLDAQKFSTEQKQRIAGRDAGARVFAPLYGIPEESATGMAAGPLACYLYDKLDIKKRTLIIEQGHLMNPPSPSELTAELSIADGKITKLMVGGRAVESRKIEVEVD